MSIFPPASRRKLRYLLVMPRLVQRVGDGYSFPLGIAYISSSMKAEKLDVVTLNLNHHPGEVEEIIAREIRQHAIDVVATGGLSFQYNAIRRVVETAKKVRSGIITIVGGGIITSDPVTSMTALEHVDYGVVGEGEQTIRELGRCLEEDTPIHGVNGVIYRHNGVFIQTMERTEIKNLDSLPWPDYDGFDLEQYLASSPAISGLNKTHTVFMIASRSCPYNCTFCFHTTGQKYRQRSLDKFFEELEYMIARYKIDFLCLADRQGGGVGHQPPRREPVQKCAGAARPRDLSRGHLLHQADDGSVRPADPSTHGHRPGGDCHGSDRHSRIRQRDFRPHPRQSPRGDQRHQHLRSDGARLPVRPQAPGGLSGSGSLTGYGRGRKIENHCQADHGFRQAQAICSRLKLMLYA